MQRISIIYCSLFVITLISCNQHSSDKNKVSVEKHLDTTASDNSDIYGNWNMCASMSNDLMIDFNVCPIAIFNKDGNGSIGNSLVQREWFNWSLHDGVLTILYPVKTSTTTFPDTIYYVNLNRQDNNLELRIEQRKKDIVFYLSRKFGNND